MSSFDECANRYYDHDITLFTARKVKNGMAMLRSRHAKRLLDKRTDPREVMRICGYETRGGMTKAIARYEGVLNGQV